VVPLAVALHLLSLRKLVSTTATTLVVTPVGA
jgi:hypothetical protein